eukprot:1059397_1
MTDETLAVDVPVTDDEYEEDEAIRAQAKINSPKGNPNTDNYLNADDNNGNGMTLNLTVDDDDDNEADGYDDDNVTPNTKRDQMDVNSPRTKTKQEWVRCDYKKKTEERKG